ncbi:lytic transglycosylase domain-containing protein [Hydrogenophaga pseudoflava]|uniref:lytic transglycosylase domain-containing protein n=1 Tax=Hydrogenophaga pseudoflava TaxID=47421 RepID=UPI0027E5B7C5|nr:transglycosylase SLT domain-containing protein [Hydrogenophaga pseudoflava]MDQ7744004.1 transglycosylase SLT domain-containing protein [Hydrogenophaga pseudoflava]
MSRRARAFGGVLLAVALAAPSHAEIWAYRDKSGVTHYADRPIHARYELLYRGSGAGGPIARPGSGSRPLLAPASAVTRMELSTRFKAVRHLIREAASQHGLEFELLQAVIATESGFDSGAVSPKGAVGLMQVIPDTAERFGVRATGRQSVSERLTDPRTNIQTGARYLAWLINYFNGDVRLAVAAYNAGEGAVLKAGRRIPNYPETIDYVRKVTDLHLSLKPPRTVSEARAEAIPAAAPLPPRPPGRG